MLFYAPVRGMREVRDRGTLAPDALIAMIAAIGLFVCLSWLYPSPVFSFGGSRSVLAIVFQAAGSLVFIALVLSPLVLFVANLFERRASYRLVLQQEYTGLTSTFFYTFTLANLLMILIGVIGKLSGATTAFSRRMLDAYLQQRAQLPPDAAGSVDPR